MPAPKGDILWEQLRELWQMVSGAVSERDNPEEITLFKSREMALWEVETSRVVYKKALAQGSGTRV